MDIILNRLFKPENPWVRGLFSEYESRDPIDDSTSRTLASVTGWDGDEDDRGHRLHNAVLMVNVTTEDLMYHLLYNFLLDADVLGLGSWPERRIEWLIALGLHHQPQHSSIHSLKIDDVISIALLVSSSWPRPEYTADTPQTELTRQGRRDYTRATLERGKASLKRMGAARATSSGSLKQPDLTPMSVDSLRVDKQDSTKTPPSTREPNDEDFYSYMRRRGLTVDNSKQEDIPRRAAAKSRADYAMSPLARKAQAESVTGNPEIIGVWDPSDDSQSRSAGEGNPTATKLGDTGVSGEIDEDELSTESDAEAEPQCQRPGGARGRLARDHGTTLVAKNTPLPGTTTRRGTTGSSTGVNVTGSPNKRSRGPSSTIQTSPPKKSRVSSNLTNRSITPIAPTRPRDRSPTLRGLDTDRPVSRMSNRPVEPYSSARPTSPTIEDLRKARRVSVTTSRSSSPFEHTQPQPASIRVPKRASKIHEQTTRSSSRSGSAASRSPALQVQKKTNVATNMTAQSTSPAEPDQTQSPPPGRRLTYHVGSDEDTGPSYPSGSHDDDEPPERQPMYYENEKYENVLIPDPDRDVELPEFDLFPAAKYTANRGFEESDDPQEE